MHINVCYACYANKWRLWAILEVNNLKGIHRFFNFQHSSMLKSCSLICNTYDREEISFLSILAAIHVKRDLKRDKKGKFCIYIK